MAAGLTLAAIAPDLPLAGVALALTGSVGAPSAVLSYLAAERLAGPGVEASTWINTAWNGGLAAGVALAGLAIGRAGTITPLLVGAAVLAVAALAVRGSRSVFDGQDPAPRPAEAPQPTPQPTPRPTPEPLEPPQPPPHPTPRPTLEPLEPPQPPSTGERR
jgi:outer membrane biosynthesis protein TonB